MYRNMLINKLCKLKELESEIEIKLKGAPEGQLIISHKRGKPLYYLKNEQANNSDGEKQIKRIYLGKKQHELAVSLANKEYQYDLLDAVREEIKNIERFLKKDKGISLTGVYNMMNSARKEVVEPLVINSLEYADSWMEEIYESKGFTNLSGEFYTKKGERVRSKSEVIIADALYDRGIYYKYEKPLRLRSGDTFYPDFTILILATGEERYYEHFGRMDDPDYIENAFMWKMKRYGQSGIVLGKNLYATFESSALPLGTKELGECIDQIEKDALGDKEELTSLYHIKVD